MDKKYKEWLESLQVGDEVAIENHFYSQSKYVIVKILTITPKHRIIETERSSSHFKKGNSGGSWGEKIIPVTEEIREAVFRIESCAKLKGLRCEKLSTEKIKRIMEIIGE